MLQTMHLKRTTTAAASDQPPGSPGSPRSPRLSASTARGNAGQLMGKGVSNRNDGTSSSDVGGYYQMQKNGGWEGDGVEVVMAADKLVRFGKQRGDFADYLEAKMRMAM